MKNNPQAGNSSMEAIIILVILIAIALISPKGSPSSGGPSNNTFLGGGGESLSTGGSGPVAPDSSYAKSVYLGTGNAAYAYQPYEEYITIDNRGREAVNITGWQLQNAKDKRAYDSGGTTLQYFQADIAYIPQAALFLSPYGYNRLQNVTLEPGETAYVTTGQIGSQTPYKIVSFKENICSGYLEDMDEYAFTPPLRRDCPRPANEPGVSSLDTECRRFIERMSSCRTPEFNTRNREGEICTNCVDGVPLSSACVAFIKNRFNYASCIAYHQNDSDFSGRTWRIFLGKGWEMWAQRYETISLFDLLGRLVTSRSY